MILLGDCLERLKELEANSIDAVITDPPYGFKFIGIEMNEEYVEIATKRLEHASGEKIGQ